MSFSNIVKPMQDLLPKKPDSMNIGSASADTQMTAPAVNTNPDLRQPDKLSKIRIIADEDGGGIRDTTTVLLNPTTISEQKSSNWMKHYIPGQDNPLLQWINGTERIVSFQVRLTKDLAENATITATSANSRIGLFDSNLKFSLNNSVSTKTANILGSLVGKKLGPLPTPNQPIPNVTYYDLDITPYLEYYRNLLRPRKSNRKNQVKTPPLVSLRMGDLLGPEELEVKKRYILVSYNTVITKLSPDLKPTDATVNLTFIEYTSETRFFDHTIPSKKSELKLDNPGKKFIKKNVVRNRIPNNIA